MAAVAVTARTGRIRIEVPQNSSVLAGEGFQAIFGGRILLNSQISFALSKPLELGVGPGRSVRSHFLDFSAPAIDFTESGIPPGTDAVVVWEPAFQSNEVHGRVSEFLDGVKLPSTVQEFDCMRFRVTLLAGFLTQQSPSIGALRLRYRLPETTAN